MPEMRSPDTAAWTLPREEEVPGQRYPQVVSERWLLVVIIVMLTTLGAAIYVAVAPRVYEAEADMLVTPVAGEDLALAGLGLIPSAGDPTRDVSTASRLIRSPAVAERVRREVDTDLSTGALLEAIRVEPIAQSSMVGLTARAGSPEEAQAIANGFGQAAIDDLSERLERELDILIPRLREQLRRRRDEGGASGGEITALSTRLTQLESLASRGRDPTLHLVTPADRPTGPVAPKPRLSLAAGVLSGLFLGLLGALALSVLDPRLRDERQLRTLYRLPILIRVPRERLRRWRANLLDPGLLLATGPSWRAVASRLLSGGGGSECQTILVAGAAPRGGKRMTALNLAKSLASSGRRVILIETGTVRSGLRRLQPGQHRDWEAALKGEFNVERVVAEATGPTGALHLLFWNRDASNGADLEGLLSGATPAQILERARELAEVVVIDSSSRTLAAVMDRVLLVVWLHRTGLRQLTKLTDELAYEGVQPTGFVVLGSVGVATTHEALPEEDPSWAPVWATAEPPRA
jgi:capsular polysaccharide biosynthesis protein/Mrp family chromosome partitioning ATPase